MNQILPKPTTPFKSKKKKKSLSDDSNYLLHDVFVLSKLAFLERGFGFGGKISTSM